MGGYPRSHVQGGSIIGPMSEEGALPCDLSHDACDVT